MRKKLTTSPVSCRAHNCLKMVGGTWRLAKPNILEMRLALSDPEAPFRNPHRMNASFDASCAQSIFNSQPAPLELL
jgi:hypothetical protein